MLRSQNLIALISVQTHGGQSVGRGEAGSKSVHSSYRRALVYAPYMDPVTAFLVLTRPRAGIAGLRRVRVDIDGRVVARLWQGKSERLSVDPGHHVVRAGTDWCRSVPIEVNLGAGEAAFIECLVPWSFIWKMIVMPGRSITCRQIERPETSS